ncbi:MAG TPA: 3-hydroxyacyl-ACP dehydratase FabZ [Desulfosalsimonadaceae bacterium]|nr:3-hydroxyacyl-ACP dehydratase FabZ [Desulfosalsimonadaceae bacterium]
MMEPYDMEKILSALPHRYPMLLVDRMLALEPGEKIVAVKNVSINEPYFQGHFPGRPVMPGVLLVEAMVQAGALLLYATLPEVNPASICFAGIDGARFRQPVGPGDQVVLEVRQTRRRSGVIKMAGLAFVQERRVAEAKLMALIEGEK